MRTCIKCGWQGSEEFQVRCPDCGWQLVETDVAKKELAAKNLHEQIELGVKFTPPTPTDKAFVDKVLAEIAEAHRRAYALARIRASNGQNPTFVDADRPSR